MSLSEAKLQKIQKYYLDDGWDGYNETRGIGKCYICHGFTSNRIKTAVFEIGCDCKYSPCSEWIETLISNRRTHENMSKNGILSMLK